MREIKIFESVDALVDGAVGIFISSAVNAVCERGVFRVALSGGQSPLPVYESLAAVRMRPAVPWAESCVFWSDERCVALDDERSNAGNAMKLLLRHVPIPRDRIYPPCSQAAGPEAAADEYELLIRRHFETQKPGFDLIMLGCGRDGHTASIFPGSDVLRERERLVAAVRGGDAGPDRITMTLPLINLARNILFIVYGEEKAPAVREALEGEGEGRKPPAAAVDPRHGTVAWLLDSGAASLLSSARKGQAED